MLWTTPESLREELPLIDKSGNLVIIADARIDNREELVDALDLGDRPRGEISDSELILGAYQSWGEDSPEKLLGDFAFAIWDRRKQRLFCARDHAGVKPFYYYLSDRVFVFASEIEALLSVPEVPRRLNEARVADLLVHNVGEKTATFYQEILRLTPANSMVVGREKSSTTTYWTLDPSRELRLRSDEEYAEAFYEVFAEAVRCRLRSAFPVGSELSGGLDSSSVACVARELLAKEGGTRRLHTLSAVYKEAPQSDESAFIDAVLAKGGFESHKVQVELLSPLEAPRSVLWDADEPSILAGLSMPWGLAREANQQGVRVLMNGYEGDVVVSHGTERLAELASTGRWGTLAAEIDAMSGGVRWSRRRMLRSWVLEPLAPDVLVRAWRMLHGASWSRTAEVYVGPIREDFARRIGINERVRTSLNVGGDVPRSVRLSRRRHYPILLHGGNHYTLEVHGKIGARLAIENRYPYYDRRLMEFCLALPPEQKLSQGWTRVVLRRALAGVVPDKVRWRRNKGSLTPGLVWSLFMFDRKLVEDTIFDNYQDIERYADLDKLLWRYIRCAAMNQPQAGDVLGPIRTVALALWLRRSGFS
jgi:asparagine synthase (glutamine-hydrolysing)